ncbi:ATP-binding protein [Caballeronia sp. S22]|uniref:hybrid sensor histidine kinase/response regulator n=1 Tax=Caballeronia sp. S22 TaxID=3137182 RepID=UPI0035311106
MAARDGHLRATEGSIGLLSRFARPNFAMHPKDGPTNNRPQGSPTERYSLELLVNSVYDYAIFGLSETGVVTSWNTGAQRLKGYSTDEIVGKHFSIFYPAERVAMGEPEENLRVAAESGHHLQEGWRVRKDGSVFWASVVISVVKDPNGKVIGFAKVTRDMTERRKLEELEASSRRMNEFLALLGHELRNPLGPVLNVVSLLKRFESPPHHIVDYARNVLEQQVGNLTRLLDDLLDVSRIKTGKVPIIRRPVSVKDIVRRAVDSVGPRIAAKRQVLEVQLPDSTVAVSGDAVRLTQVISNLLDNAHRFSSHGERIRLEVVIEHRSALIRVIDRGRGIHADRIDSVFELFFQEQAPGTTKDEGGLGVGLTLARSIVELHGGHIEGKSDGAGQGSTFTVSIPLIDQAADTPLPSSSRQLPAPKLSALKILVVDDNEESAESMALLLGVDGHEVKTAYSAFDAVDAASALRPDLILLDLSMPSMSGYEAIRLLRNAVKNDDLMVVAVTGFGLEDDRQRTSAAGFDAHMTKPVAAGALDDVVTLARVRALRKRR